MKGGELHGSVAGPVLMFHGFHGFGLIRQHFGCGGKVRSCGISWGDELVGQIELVS